MIWVTSYRVSPSLRAISSGRRPCWLYSTASRRWDGVPGWRAARRAAGRAGPGRPPCPAWAGGCGRLGRAGAARARGCPAGLGWAGAGGWLGPAVRVPVAVRGRGGAAERAAALVVVLTLGQFRLGLIVQQQVLLGRLVHPDGHHGQALEVLRLALRRHAVVVFSGPFGMQFVPAGHAFRNVLLSHDFHQVEPCGPGLVFRPPEYRVRRDGRQPAAAHAVRGHPGHRTRRGRRRRGPGPPGLVGADCARPAACCMAAP